MPFPILKRAYSVCGTPRYAVVSADIATEIQELRHKSQSGGASSASRVIDQSLATLNERLDSVSRGVQSVNESMEPILQSLKTPDILPS